MAKSFFITGTDTGVGKTLVASSLLYAAHQQGFSTLGLKPVAAGCEETETGMHNDDALMLQRTASISLPYQQVNPIALRAPMAPHIAAAREGKLVLVDRIVGVCRGAMMSARADFSVVEGAGGWRVPLGPREDMSTLARGLSMPVVLVVGLRLGCLNHSLLTAEAIVRDGLPIAGWVANQITEDFDGVHEHIDTLRRRVPGPFLGHIPYMNTADVAEASQYLVIEPLIGR